MKSMSLMFNHKEVNELTKEMLATNKELRDLLKKSTMIVGEYQALLTPLKIARLQIESLMSIAYVERKEDV